MSKLPTRYKVDIEPASSFKHRLYDYRNGFGVYVTNNPKTVKPPFVWGAEVIKNLKIIEDDSLCYPYVQCVDNNDTPLTPDGESELCFKTDKEVRDFINEAEEYFRNKVSQMKASKKK